MVLQVATGEGNRGHMGGHKGEGGDKGSDGGAHVRSQPPAPAATGSPPSHACWTAPSGDDNPCHFVCSAALVMVPRLDE